MKIKDFLKTYAYCTDVMYDTQYLNINDVEITVAIIYTEDTDNPLVHPYTGEVLDESVSGLAFMHNDEIIALVHEEGRSDLDYFSDWCENEVTI